MTRGESDNMHIEQQGDLCHLILRGRLDGLTVGQVEERFLQLVDEGVQRFVCDMTELEYISSAGLRFMLLSVKKTRAVQGKIALCGLSKSVEEVFQISGFSTIFSIFATKEEAVAHVSGEAVGGAGL